MIGSFFIATEQDRKQAQELERRKQAEVERKNRIFNPKTRLIGVDKTALDRQLEEKQMIKAQEKKLNDAFHNQMKKNTQMAEALALQERQVKQSILGELNEFRKTFQRKKSRREYDLYDSDLLKKQQPPRKETDEDIPISSAQKFEGEDLNSEERRRLMERQRMSWLEQQIQEKKAQKDLEKKTDEMVNKMMSAREQRALQLEIGERRCRQMLEAANNKYNCLLAMENNHKRIVEKEEEIQDNQAEIYNQLTSDLMIENPHSAKSTYGPHRSITYMYKGMSPEEKSYYRKQQLDQIANNMAKMELEKKVNDQWDQLQEVISSNADLNSSERLKLLRQESAKLKRENYMLSLEQKHNQKITNKILTSNVPTDEFFGKFGTSTR